MRETGCVFSIATALLVGMSGGTAANDLLRAAIPQRGLWDTAVTELGKHAGIFAKQRLDVDILYTQGGPEAYQAIISGSMDLTCGGGIEGAIGAFAKGAPLRIIGSEMVGSPDTYWYVPANSPIRSLKDAAGKTISYSQNGSSSHAAVLALLDQDKVDAKPVATGGHPATLTMAMTGQIDIGRGAAPFGLDLVENGTIRIIARGSELKARANETVRVCATNLQTLQRADLVPRYMRAYRETIDWMYSDPGALAAY
ncbi:MAG: ABC transporter substrate-binding protein, partial [Bradyrhizobiaceae bacterium]|nr:ABC transporter substrate-binding protein [Bradyrhizobiaceae bacterium]